MKASELAVLKELLATPKKIVIVPHKNPDGDAMGSTLALYHADAKARREQMLQEKTVRERDPVLL